MRNKKNLIVFGILSAVAVTGIISSISFANGLINQSKADNVYSITCTKDKNKFVGATSTFKTAANNNVDFVIAGTFTPGGKNWLSISKDAKFFNNTDIRCLSSITFNFASAGSFQLNYSKASTYKSEMITFTDNWKETYTVSENQSLTVDVPAKALHFKFESLTDNLLISSMTINFDCGDSKEWDDANGVNPVISQDNKTFTYGLYPQTHVNNSTLITNLTKKADLVGANDEQFFWYKDGVNDGFYVKDTGNPYVPSIEDPPYTFSDGTKVYKGDTHFFKCEPIKWNIVATGDTTYTIDCSNILYSHRFDDNSNVYSDSELRLFLNNDLFNQAFFLNSSYIQDTEVSTGVFDKVWVAHQNNYYNWYSGESFSLIKKQISDFAVCNYTYMNTTDESYLRNGYYWTRTSCYINNVFLIQDSGTYTPGLVNAADNGASPCLTIKK